MPPNHADQGSSAAHAHDDSPQGNDLVAHADPEARLNLLLRIEETKLKETAIAETMTELHRHRLELIGQLGEAIAEIQTERARLDDIGGLLKTRREELAGTESRAPGAVDMAAARRLKACVYAAHMELLKFEQGKQGKLDCPPSITALPISQLTRLGLGLTWPLMLAVLLAGVIVAAALVSLLV